jgi:hypothetical protein
LSTSGLHFFLVSRANCEGHFREVIIADLISHLRSANYAALRSGASEALPQACHKQERLPLTVAGHCLIYVVGMRRFQPPTSQSGTMHQT